MILYRFRDGRVEQLATQLRGRTVTWTVDRLDVVVGDEPRCHVEIAERGQDAEDVEALIVARHRADRFEELAPEQVRERCFSIEPWRSWRRLGVESLLARFRDAGFPIDAIAQAVVAIQRDVWRIDFAGDVTMHLGLPLADPARAPAALRTLVAHHAGIIVERDGFEIALGPDMAPPDPADALANFAPGAEAWVMSRGLSQYWFCANDGTLRLYDHDGGVQAPIERPLADVWIEAVADLLDD